LGAWLLWLLFPAIVAIAVGVPFVEAGH
jgi:hypothetical protein